MSTHLRGLTRVCVALLLLGGCSDQSPTAPTELRSLGRAALSNVASVDLGVNLSNPATVKAGQELIFVATVTNPSSDVIATGVTMTFSATGWSIRSISPFGSCGSGGSGSGASGSCTLGALAPGESRTFTFTGTARTTEGSSTFTATVTSDVPETDPANNSASTSVTVTAGADLLILKTGPAQVLTGETFAYDLVVRNVGAAASAGAVVTDNMPMQSNQGLDVQSATSSAGTCTITSVQDPQANFIAFLDRVTCDLGPLAPGAEATVRIMVLYMSNQNKTGSYTNRASVSGADGDVNTGNNSSSATTVFAPADIAATLTGPATALTGESIPYSAVVANQGPDRSHGSFSLTITGGTVLSVTEPANARCFQPSATRVSCNWNLDAGESSTVGLDLVRSTAGTIRVDAVASTTISGIDPNSADNSASVSTTVRSPTPVVVLSGPTQVQEGTTQGYSFSITTPSGSFSLTTTTCGSAGSLVSGSVQTTATGGSLQCFFGDGAASTTVTVSAHDASFNTTGSADRAVAIANVIPSATFVRSPASLPEGSAFTLTMSDAHDVAADAPTLEYAFDCGSGYGNYGSVASHSCAAPDDALLSVRAKVRDKDRGEREYNGSVTVSNVAPQLLPFAAPAAPAALGSLVTMSAAFTDPGSLDTHVGSVQWDFDSPFVAADAIAFGARQVSASTATLGAGVYTMSLRVRDKDGGEDTRIATGYLVIYDPTSGFVTGGGWIASPLGACRLSLACQAAEGKASFGFVSKYLRGASLPSGNTEFQFQAGNLRFKSSAYDWLVVSGARGKFKGQGTINGAGNYGFMVTAIDGQLAGGLGVDRFRIKIWDVATDAVVYDNQAGKGDDADDATALGGGSIVIHKP